LGESELARGIVKLRHVSTGQEIEVKRENVAQAVRDVLTKISEQI
jgi:histidyl-tRNA synthetase